MDNQLQVLVVSLACVYICSDTPGVNINNPSDAPSRNIILCVVTTTFIGIWFIEVFFDRYYLPYMCFVCVVQMRKQKDKIVDFYAFFSRLIQSGRSICLFISVYSDLIRVKIKRILVSIFCVYCRISLDCHSVSVHTVKIS